MSKKPANHAHEPDYALAAHAQQLSEKRGLQLRKHQTFDCRDSSFDSSPTIPPGRKASLEPLTGNRWLQFLKSKRYGLDTHGSINHFYVGQTGSCSPFVILLIVQRDN